MGAARISVGTGLGIRGMPAPMPRVMTRDVTSEVSASSALSLFTRAGDGRIQARRVGMPMADGCDAEPLVAQSDRLTCEGAVPRFKHQHRHRKSILAPGERNQLLEACGISPSPPRGEPGSGLITAPDQHLDLRLFAACTVRCICVHADHVGRVATRTRPMDVADGGATTSSRTRRSMGRVLEHAAADFPDVD
jgi:hypothetical protein